MTSMRMHMFTELCHGCGKPVLNRFGCEECTKRKRAEIHAKGIATPEIEARMKTRKFGEAFGASTTYPEERLLSDAHEAMKKKLGHAPLDFKVDYAQLEMRALASHTLQSQYAQGDIPQISYETLLRYIDNYSEAACAQICDAERRLDNRKRSTHPYGDAHLRYLFEQIAFDARTDIRRSRMNLTGVKFTHEVTILIADTLIQRYTAGYRRSA